jgi:hypothetical protein
MMKGKNMTETMTDPLPAVAPSPAASAPPPSAGDAVPQCPQLPGESDRAMEAFRVYLALGPRRRYAAVVRSVGASLRTVRRWANEFDWRGRIRACAAQGVEQYVEAENAARQAEFLDAAARAKAFRDRQYTLAEAILDAAERYLECADFEDLDQMTFADACKALEVASRLAHLADDKSSDDASAPARNLRDQLASLLDQAYGDAPAKNGAVPQPQSPSSHESHA